MKWLKYFSLGYNVVRPSAPCGPIFDYERKGEGGEDKLRSRCAWVFDWGKKKKLHHNEGRLRCLNNELIEETGHKTKG